MRREQEMSPQPEERVREEGWYKGEISQILCFRWPPTLGQPDVSHWFDVAGRNGII